MKRPLSIRVRFLLVSLIAVPLALALAALFMTSMFSASLERRLEEELKGHINTIAGSIRLGADGRIEHPFSLMDRRFTEAYGGLYWQIGDAATPAMFRSESLWDTSLSSPEDVPDDGAVHRYEAAGPNDTRLIVLERQIMVSAPAGLKPVQISVASDTRALDEASRGFALDILPYLAGLAAFLVGASLVQVFYGLKPLADLTKGLDRIRERHSGRLEGALPVEFVPVEAAVNRLLESQAQSLAKARARAGDLAHGLKTPLTVLSNDALTLRERGEGEIADEIEQLVRLMRGHVEHELARSRIVANADMRQTDADIEKIVGQVVKTLQRTPKGEGLTWTVEIGAPPNVPLDAHDLRELIGNLTENAVKWATGEVCIGWKDGRLVVADDGPGVDPDKIRSMTERGVRLDSQTPGTGFGLSIVKEICEVYGLALSIENRQGSGLMVSVGFGDAA
ncbi:sensor histidine kinase [Rhizobium panacihumi]|uniref:sensor histidine kinase n=1 Tax=Rhizobium panacihumi TaxID=2008450 RepID=UPI003D79F340